MVKIEEKILLDIFIQNVFVCSCYFILLNHKHKSKDLCGRWRKASCGNKIKFKWDFLNKNIKIKNGAMFVSPIAVSFC